MTDVALFIKAVSIANSQVLAAYLLLTLGILSSYLMVIVAWALGSLNNSPPFGCTGARTPFFASEPID